MVPAAPWLAQRYAYLGASIFYWAPLLGCWKAGVDFGSQELAGTKMLGIPLVGRRLQECIPKVGGEGVQEWLKWTRHRTSRHQDPLRWHTLPLACENYFVGLKDLNLNVKKYTNQNVVHVFANQPCVLFIHVLPLFITSHTQTLGQFSTLGTVSQTCSRFWSVRPGALALCGASMVLEKGQSVLV